MLAPRTAVIAGATGLVGGYLLSLLLEDAEYQSVTALSRRPLGVSHPRLVERIIDFDQPAAYAPHTGATDVFCCLGTTIRKAGSKEAFRRVDHDYPVALAQAAAAAGAQQLLIVTALGANPRSLSFYHRVKGEVEGAVRRLPFSGGVQIFRPTFFYGGRKESRPGEAMGVAVLRGIAPLLIGGLRKHRPIPARDVAQAMWRCARRPPGRVVIHESDEIVRLAAGEG